MNTAVLMVWRMGPKYGLQESSRDPSPGSRRPTVSGRVTVGRRGWSQCQAGQHARGRAGHCRHDHWHAPCRLVVSHSSVFLSLFACPVEDGKRPHTGRCGMVGVQRVKSGDFHRGRPVSARLQTELACRFRRTADGEWSSSFPSTYMQNRLIPTFSRYLPKFLNKK